MTSKPANQRGAARLAAVQALYQMEIGHISMEETMAQFNAHHLGKEVEGEQYLPADADYFSQIVKGVLSTQIDIDPKINAALNDDWPVTRIDATLRAILRCAGFELLRKPDVPENVIISEYLDVTRAFFDDDAVKLVNGVLETLKKNRSTD